MATLTQRLYESPEEGSFVDLQWDSITLLGTGVRIVSGTGKPLQVSITHLGVTHTKTFAPGSDVTWTFAVAPALSGKIVVGLSAVSVQHANGLVPSVSSGLVL